MKWIGGTTGDPTDTRGLEIHRTPVGSILRPPTTTVHNSFQFLIMGLRPLPRRGWKAPDPNPLKTRKKWDFGGFAQN